MAEPRNGIAKAGFDVLRLGGLLCFLLAVGFAATMAFRAGPETLAGLLLLVGLAGVAFIGLIAFRGGAREAPHAGEAELAQLVQALDEPAAICVTDGLILAANTAWREAVGSGRRLPKNGGGLFAALSDARSVGRGEGRIRAGKTERQAVITLMGPDRLLLRLAEAPSAKAAAAAPAAIVPTPAALDAFASASPFGAALIDGTDAFAAPILEANPALAAIAGAGATVGASLGGLIKPESMAEAVPRPNSAVAGPAER